MLKWYQFISESSGSEEVDSEIIQEIIYNAAYIESSEENNSFYDKGEIGYEILDLMSKKMPYISEYFYETSYEGTNDIISKYIKFCQDDPNFYDEMRKIYLKIRNINKKFPKICLIEDIFLEYIDKGYSFSIFIYPGKYYDIKIQSGSNQIITVDNFEELIKKMITTANRRLSVNGLKSTVKRCHFDSGTRKDGEDYSYFTFLIKLI